MVNGLSEADEKNWDKQKSAPAHLASRYWVGVEELPHRHEGHQPDRLIVKTPMSCG